MATRDELVAAVADRYARSDRSERGRILDEFVAVTGHHRKHAMRLLRGGKAAGDRQGQRRGRVYDAAVREALIVLWEASDRVCGKRLRPLLPVLVEAMERHGHLQLAPEVRTGVLAMSAATIDRALRAVKDPAGGKKRRRTPPSAAVRRSVPVRTFSDWQDPAPGFVEADLVAHSGPTARGSFVQTLVLTDIATGWTECAPLLVREQRLLTEVLGEVRKLLPFPLLGFDTDNDTVFMNETVQAYCANAGVAFTRCRPYRKNDQAFVEQKNGAVVRRIVGYRRLRGWKPRPCWRELYRSVRLFVNFFQPSFKLAAKSRDGAKVRKRYHPPATPYQRLLADARVTGGGAYAPAGNACDAGPGSAAAGDPHSAGSSWSGLRTGRSVCEQPAPTVPTLEQFLAGLRTAWQEGEVRPTAKPKPQAKRLATAPGPPCGGHGATARVVRGAAVADIARAAGAAAVGGTRDVSGQAAADPAAAREALAPRGGPPDGVRDV